MFVLHLSIIWDFTTKHYRHSFDVPVFYYDVCCFLALRSCGLVFVYVGFLRFVFIRSICNVEPWFELEAPRNESIISAWHNGPEHKEATRQFAMICVAQNCLRKEKSGELRSTLVAVARDNEHVKATGSDLPAKFSLLLTTAK